MHIPEPKGKFETAPEGTCVGVCYRVLDLGTQQSEYQGEKKYARKVMLSWELPEELMADGRPFSIHQSYTLSMHEKATLRKHLESWRGRKFDQTEFGPNGFSLTKLLGAGCLLTITHAQKGENTYANITGVAKLMKDMKAPQSANPHIYFSMENQESFERTRGVLDSLSEHVRTKISSSPEYIARVRGEPDERPSSDDFEINDEIPF